MDGWTLLHQADGMDGNGCTDLHFHPFHPFEKVRGVDRHTVVQQLICNLSPRLVRILWLRRLEIFDGKWNDF
jgi:hypothetical protein